MAARHKTRRLTVDSRDGDYAASIRDALADGTDWLSIALDDGAALHDDWTHDQKAGIFLRTLATTNSVSAACDAAHISRQTAYTWRGDDPRFAHLWDAALLRVADTYERLVFERAKAGSELMTIFGTKATNPRYKDNYQPPPQQAASQTFRWQTAEEAAPAIEAEYRIRELPEHAGEGEE